MLHPISDAFYCCCFWCCCFCVCVLKGHAYSPPNKQAYFTFLLKIQKYCFCFASPKKKKKNQKHKIFALFLFLRNRFFFSLHFQWLILKINNKIKNKKYAQWKRKGYTLNEYLDRHQNRSTVDRIQRFFKKSLERVSWVNIFIYLFIYITFPLCCACKKKKISLTRKGSS